MLQVRPRPWSRPLRAPRQQKQLLPLAVRSPALPTAPSATSGASPRQLAMQSMNLWRSPQWRPLASLQTFPRRLPSPRRSPTQLQWPQAKRLEAISGHCRPLGGLRSMRASAAARRRQLWRRARLPRRKNRQLHWRWPPPRPSGIFGSALPSSGQHCARASLWNRSRRRRRRRSLRRQVRACGLGTGCRQSEGSSTSSGSRMRTRAPVLR
mmetsp:Transcript_18116/g.45721  ORF Transcript_18116/g.45721 Transcript_18116/m.45721 type:complete len:210 (-) Transcript_18116:127-756(-)